MSTDLARVRDRVTYHQHDLARVRDRVTYHQHDLARVRDRVTMSTTWSGLGLGLP